MRFDFARRLVSLLTIVVVLTGCSKAVEIQQHEIQDVRWQQPGSYRIRLKGREEYLARRFSVTDSTIVIEELQPSDKRYRLERASFPLAVPSSDVESISVMKLNKGITFGLIGGTVLVIGLLMWIDTWELNID